MNVYIVLLRVEGMPIPGMALCIIGHTIACAIKTRESQVRRYTYIHMDAFIYPYTCL